MKAVLNDLLPEDLIALEYDWKFWARKNQLPPAGDWLTWLVLSGRGYGKTRVGAEWVRSIVESGKYGRIALVAETAADARDVMVMGESGLLACSPPTFRPVYEPSKRRITWPNGAIATTFSAEEPDQLRGPQFDAAWLDELAKWDYAQQAWDMLQFGLRLGEQPRQVITTTPRPLPILKAIVHDPLTVITRGSTFENTANLAPSFIQTIKRRYEGTRLGRQELEAEILEDVPGALWTRDMIEKTRVKVSPPFRRIVVAIDPPITSGEDSDECGIIVAGEYNDEAYVIADRSAAGNTPNQWALKAVQAYEAFEADAIVAEVNNGGEMVTSVIRNIDPKVPVIQVRATRGKYTRAEPVSSLYEQGRAHHVGSFPRLEDQMCNMTPDFDKQKAGYSPDRLDAMVWALTNLMINPRATPRIRSL